MTIDSRFAALLALAVLAPVASAEEPPPRKPPPDLSVAPSAGAPTAGAPIPAPGVGPSAEFPNLKATPLSRPSRWGLAVFEGPIAWSFVQNRFAYHLGDPEVYDVSWDNFVDHLNGPWWYDQDQFATNQFGHPYEGSMYYTAARSLGLSFWESWLNAELGSLVWEMAAETEPPSVNDQITTPIAGSFLGEILYRMSARLVDAMSPGFWREISVTAVSPFHGLNRQIVGDYRSRHLSDQPWFGEMSLFLDLGGTSHTSGVSDYRGAGAVGFALKAQNGNPGGDWEFREPFDYFDASFSLILDKDAAGKKALGNILMRGLLIADDYGEGRSRGHWGMMGAYDYLTPGTFRVSSSNVTLGTVGQVALRPDLAFQGTAYGGLGYGAGGSASEPAGKRDYHFGLQQVLLLEGRLLFGDAGALRVTGREYYTSGKVSPETDSFEFVWYGEVEALARVYGPHAVSVTFIGAHRRAQYTDVPDIRSSARQVTVGWTLLTDRFFGAGR